MKIINENGRIGVEEIAEYQNLRLIALLESMKKGDPETYGVIAMSLTRGNGFVHLDANEASPVEIMGGMVRGVARVLLAITDQAPIGGCQEFTKIFADMVKNEVAKLCQ